MGALTEMRDKWDNENSYYYAKDLYEKYHGAPIPKHERENLPKDTLFINRWYDHFRGTPYQSFTYYIPWFFDEGFFDSIDAIRTICDITEGVSCRIRTAKEDDFFMFCPKEIEGEVLEIVNEATYPPHILNLIFGNIPIKYSEYGNYMYFTW